MNTSLVREEVYYVYRKYFITLSVENRLYYIIWGDDLTDNNNVRILLDANKNIILFKSMEEALHYVLNIPDELFDKFNMQKWAAACLERGVISDVTYNLNDIESIINSDQFSILPEKKNEDYLYLWNFIGLVSDYAYQVDDKHLISIYEGEYFEMFTEYGYDSYLWTIPKEEMSARHNFESWKLNYPKFKQDILNMLNTFKVRFTFYNDN